MTTINLAAYRCSTHYRKTDPYRIRLVVSAADGTLQQRIYSQSPQKVASVGNWSSAQLPLAPGLYCEACIRMGNIQTALLDDNFETIADDLGDITPFILVDAQKFDATAVADAIDERYGPAIHRTRIPAVEPSYSEWDDIALHPELLRVVRTRILPPDARLYAFQGKAIASILARKHTIVTTPTASGKSLTYLLPAFDAILRQPQARVLYISPLNALSEDQMDAMCRFDESGKDWHTMARTFEQYRSLRALKIAGADVKIGRYDGTVENRQAIRDARPHIILTNPDMLHIGILTNPAKWDWFFSKLTHIVIDEVHTYRGIMGSAMANVIRRLRATCATYGSDPTIVCASATIAHPKEVMQRLAGVEFTVIDGEQSAPQRERILMVRSAALAPTDEPATVESVPTKQPARASLALTTIALQTLYVLYEQHIRTLMFGRSIRDINQILQLLSRNLQLTEAQQTRIQSYYRELAQTDKMRILNDMRNGHMHMILSTTALSMGIDIGNLSAVVIAGFPGSIAEFWQQAGRAGRNGQGLVVFLASVDALNQFFARNPDALFNLRAQPMFLNPDNPYIVRRHMLAYIAVTGKTEADMQIFGSQATEILDALRAEGIVVQDPGSPILRLSNPEGSLSGFRDTESSPIEVRDGDKTITKVDQGRALRALHFQAIYMVQYEYYQVTRTDWQAGTPNGVIRVEKIPEPEYFTEASIEATVLPILPFESASHPDILQFNRDVQITQQAIGYMRHDMWQRQNKPEYRALDKKYSSSITSHSHGLRIILNPEVYTRTLALGDTAAGIASFMIALRLATAIEQLCDAQDIDYSTSGELTAHSSPELWLFETASGGNGICEAVWQHPVPVFERALAILKDCPHCSTHPESRGCVYCAVPRFGDESTINRLVGIALLEGLLVQLG
jgi:DEAD/DEAH box helicase domain-containing protein